MPADTTPTAPEPSTDAHSGVTAVGAGPTVPTPRPAPSVESTDDLASDDDGVDAEPSASAVGLTERERAILAFEQQWWRHAGAKEQAVRDTFGVSSTRYYQLLNGLLDNPAALAADPVLIGRLRRLRSSRARNRRR
ncbi:DUF3263 domain-containing protein [Micromonospora parathelypteridis]|uniref:DUF3263 domain-containing protein n=1 Tax=Micromonospora parathelypteridis TaxID=1839617 RepID=A0A840VPJ6_9ACTN|nr:DUF3263 domain-containing protein [Micromonospora parathelypteridis]MBB5477896.1 hypothetical protein [Micromonospora parathelypteridis]GGO12185.1 hypothetical protein GCM10011576_21360 [Micromonospora parathelypteridis]